MRGKSKFERKQAVLEVDEFVVEAATILPHDQYNRFANNLLYDYDFIIEQNDMMRVDTKMLLLSENLCLTRFMTITVPPPT